MVCATLDVRTSNPLEAIDIERRHSSDEDNPSALVLHEVLRSMRQIAVVGMSRHPEKVARRVPSYLAAQGYRVIPVNPYADRILGKDACDVVTDIEHPVDMVLVFRPSRDAGDVIRQAMTRPEIPVIWLQEGIRHDEAANKARSRGFTVIQDLCIYKVHRTYMRAVRYD